MPSGGKHSGEGKPLENKHEASKPSQCLESGSPADVSPKP